MKDLKTLSELDYMPQHGDVVQSPNGVTGWIDGEDTDNGWRYETDMPVYRMFVLHSTQYPDWIGKYHNFVAEGVFDNWYLLKKKKVKKNT
jgi:hypothetical protein